MRLIASLLILAGLAAPALAQPPSSNLPEWAAPLGEDTRPVLNGSTSSALDSDAIDPFPDDPVQAPMQGLVLLALAGAAYGARRLRRAD